MNATILSNTNTKRRTNHQKSCGSMSTTRRRPMNSKKVWVGLLCLLLIVILAGQTFAQEKETQKQPQRKSRGSWKVPNLGTEIQDFELPILGGGSFKLSGLKGKIVIIELGACHKEQKERWMHSTHEKVLWQRLSCGSGRVGSPGGPD
jgi:hypothetical protein